MRELRLFDLSFMHQKGTSLKSDPSLFKWYRGHERRDITVFTDLCLTLANSIKDTIKIALIIEPYVINAHPYELLRKWTAKNTNPFDYVLCHSKTWTPLLGNSTWYPFGSLWVEEQENPKKNALVSIVASNKNYAPGHQIRHKIIAEFKDKLSVFGGGYNPIKDKTEAIAPYYFSIAIENCKIDGYFTEKLIDCFATKTIPIYWGGSISEYFDKNGVIEVHSHEEWKKAIDSLSVELYESKRESIEKNYLLAKNYYNCEDWIYQNILYK